MEDKKTIKIKLDVPGDFSDEEVDKLNGSIIEIMSNYVKDKEIQRLAKENEEMINKKVAIITSNIKEKIHVVKNG